MIDFTLEDNKSITKPHHRPDRYTSQFFIINSALNTETSSSQQIDNKIALFLTYKLTMLVHFVSI
ncbi:hypothetical protein R7D94_10630 [Vibrio sp. Vb2658]|uniref:hypothetical protein n=1 Tax=Vibrio alginolyticus TaxID=663 RepID=UPI000AE0AAC1|nr:hypothetical protein [Vibrio alginolyticus]MCR9463327.1 hypothetical protein [Vibrio alginolyticus]MDW1658795.1 hypothetical protein [Vibrio sp. Vb2658]